MYLDNTHLLIYAKIFEEIINRIYGGIYYDILCMRLKLPTSGTNSPPYMMVKKPSAFYESLVKEFANGMEFMAKAFLRTFIAYIIDLDPEIEIPPIDVIIDSIKSGRTDVVNDFVIKVVSSNKLRRMVGY